MNKFSKLENLRQNVFIETGNKKEFDINSLVLEVLEKNKIYIDLHWIKTENDLLDLLYFELNKIDKIKEILKFYDISRNRFWFLDFDHISDEIEIA